ncbi:rRNA maturation RNase YbeY [Candidatus Uhrbacteria bacterium]|nr:rRNA maturation RNase YbeY [Candidatus Uhrbacteria bacterium]
MIRAELNQSQLRGGQRLPARLVARTLREVERELRLKKDVAFSVAFVSPAQMRKLNRAWRGKDRVTDVLSFELAGEQTFGEVLISYDQARRQARERGAGAREEVLFLLVHGILHLFGYDHERSKDAKRMFPLQAKILTRLGIDPRL